MARVNAVSTELDVGSYLILVLEFRYEVDLNLKEIFEFGIIICTAQFRLIWLNYWLILDVQELARFPSLLVS